MSKDFNFDVLKLPFEKDQWVDADERIFQACFTILGQYVEEELGPSDAPEDGHNGYRLHAADMKDEPSIDRKFIDLWLWYKNELPKLQEDYDRDIEEVYKDAMSFGPVEEGEFRQVIIKRSREPKYEHDYPETVKEQKLQELIELRRWMWT